MPGFTNGRIFFYGILKGEKGRWDLFEKSMLLGETWGFDFMFLW